MFEGVRHKLRAQTEALAKAPGQAQANAPVEAPAKVLANMPKLW